MTTVLDVPTQLALMTAKVRTGEPFFHTRWNDGEFCTMFGLRGEEATLNDEHHCFASTGAALRDTFEKMMYCSLKEVIRQELVKEVPAVQVGDQQKLQKTLLVGSYWPTQLHLDEFAAPFVTWIRRAGYIPEKIFQWCAGDLWYTNAHEAIPAAGLLSLLDAVRESPKPKVLVCNKEVAQTAGCLAAAPITVPKADAWLSRESVIRNLDYVPEGAIYIWAAGLPAKIWSWDICTADPTSTHIDAGSLFDGACGLFNRAWLRRRNTIDQDSRAHWLEYESQFIPYVKRFQR